MSPNPRHFYPGLVVQGKLELYYGPHSNSDGDGPREALACNAAVIDVNASRARQTHGCTSQGFWLLTPVDFCFSGMEISAHSAMSMFYDQVRSCGDKPVYVCYRHVHVHPRHSKAASVVRP